MGFKKYISSFFRLLKLGWLADGCRYAFVYCKRYAANRAYAVGHKKFAFPPPYYMYETYTLDYKAYLEDGRQTAGEIMVLLSPYINFGEAGKTIADWGCGPGRVVRHLPGIIGQQHKIIGCDYNDVYIKWCAQNISGVNFLNNTLEPPLPLPPGSTDAVYGLSIFTHLSAQAHIVWAAELCWCLRCRVAKAGKGCCLPSSSSTTKGSWWCVGTTRKVTACMPHFNHQHSCSSCSVILLCYSTSPAANPAGWMVCRIPGCCKSLLA
jgi:SAM-dependent methyltransferase